jgi:hypothetical protein
MLRKLLIAGALAAVIAVPAVARAHEGHAHKVMGTVSSVDGNDLMVKTTDGKTVMVMLTAKTKITRGKEKLVVSALKVGDRVVAEGAEDKGMVTAATLQVGVAEKPAAVQTAKPAESHSH